MCDNSGQHLAAEAVQGASLPLQGIHHIEGCDCLAACVLCVGDGVSDDILQEHLQSQKLCSVTELAGEQVQEAK